jgi:hypothetical protein
LATSGNYHLNGQNEALYFDLTTEYLLHYAITAVNPGSSNISFNYEQSGEIFLFIK